MSIVMATNSSGTEKLPLLFLGKAKKPRWLPKKPATALYQGTSKGWMTVSVFQEWLRDLDKTMGEARRKIMLLVGNAPVHITPDDTLANVKVEFLPPNTTAAVQPMDQGVMRSPV
jgi:hypothetical protein